MSKRMIHANLITRIDAAIYAFKMRPVYFLDGYLYQRMDAGHGVELRSHFPGWLFRAYAKVMNRFPRLRELEKHYD